MKNGIARTFWASVETVALWLGESATSIAAKFIRVAGALNKSAQRAHEKAKP